MSRRAQPRQPVPASTPAPIPQATDGSAPNPPPPANHSIIDAINASGNVTLDDGAQVIIEGQPDMRFPVSSFIYSIQASITATAYQANPHASPASLLAYTIIMYTGLLFFNEYTQRPSFTTVAATIQNDIIYSSFFNALLDLPVPPFADMEFNSARTFFHPLATNLVICPNLCAASFLHDFGRLIPAATFIRLHNLMSNLPANTTPAALAHAFYTSTVALVEFTAGTNVNITPAMLFGASHGNYTYNNWFRNRIDRIVTALAIRPVFTGPTIGPLPVSPLPNANNNNFNAYLWLTGLDHDNYDTLLQFVRSLGSFTKSIFPSAKPLRDYAQTGTSSSAGHLIFIAPVPTWSTSATTFTAPSGSTAGTPDFLSTATNVRSHTSFARDTTFLVAPRDPTTQPTAANEYWTAHRLRAPDPAVNFGYAPEVTESAAPAAGTLDPLHWLVSGNPANANEHTPHQMTTPNCLIFLPSDITPGSLASPITSGFVIENYDISATILPNARPDMTLHATNATLVLGSIEISNIYTALNTNVRLHVQHVPAFDHTTVPQGYLRGPHDWIRFALARNGIIRTISATAGHLANHFLGMLPVNNVRRPHQAINAFLRPLGSHHGIDVHHAHLWSSYRFRERQGNTIVISMIPSLRPIFGAQARHAQSQHPTLRYN
jgi:hypothetical protein